MAEAFVGRTDRLEDAIDEFGDVGGALDAGLNDGEFVAAESGHESDSRTHADRPATGGALYSTSTIQSVTIATIVCANSEVGGGQSRCAACANPISWPDSAATNSPSFQYGVKSAADVTELVNRIFEAIRAPYECLGHQVTTDASIGIAIAPQDGSDLDQILKNADLAMYAAKAAGRRTSRFFEPAMEAEVPRPTHPGNDLATGHHGWWLRGLLPALSQPAGRQHYRLRGAAALAPSAAWHDLAADFIPIAEETGLINQLGEWVLTTACREAATWPDHVRLAVNVSRCSSRAARWALKVIAALAASGLAAGRLELEITEAVLIRDDDAALPSCTSFATSACGSRSTISAPLFVAEYLQRFPFRQDQDRPLLHHRSRLRKDRPRSSRRW